MPGWRDRTISHLVAKVLVQALALTIPPAREISGCKIAVISSKSELKHLTQFKPLKMLILIFVYIRAVEFSSQDTRTRRQSSYRTAGEGFQTLMTLTVTERHKFVLPLGQD